MAEKRKSAKDYRNEYQDLLDKTKALESRIKKRALDLCKKFPDILINPNNNNIVTKRFYDIYKDGENVQIEIYLKVIQDIEEYNAKQSGYVQTSMYEDELSQEDIMKAKPKEYPDFIEYEDNGDDYVHPERTEVAEILEIRLYCMHDGCNKYIKGKEGYNGSFTAETGQYCDLRNQGFTCKEHCK